MNAYYAKHSKVFIASRLMNVKPLIGIHQLSVYGFRSISRIILIMSVCNDFD